MYYELLKDKIQNVYTLSIEVDNKTSLSYYELSKVEACKLDQILSVIDVEDEIQVHMIPDKHIRTIAIVYTKQNKDIIKSAKFQVSIKVYKIIDELVEFFRIPVYYEKV